jgi:hypothetical protein
VGDVRSGKLIRQQQRDLLVAHVAVSALIDLHQLVMDCGFTRSSQDDSSIVQEEQHQEPVAIRSAAVRDPLGFLSSATFISRPRGLSRLTPS